MSADPTAIPIQFDPRAQRMTGVTAHGDVPFDVPFISQIDDTLWVGGCTDGLILPRDIEHLVSLYPWESYRQSGELKSLLCVRMYDSLDQALDQVKAISAWVNSCRADGPTLVHCQAGLNRSNLVAATALILAGATPTEAIETLREKRSPAVLCNTAFARWLLEEAA